MAAISWRRDAAPQRCDQVHRLEPLGEERINREIAPAPLPRQTILQPLAGTVRAERLHLCRALLRSPRARQRFVGWTSSSIDGLRPVQAMPGSNISTARWWSGLRRPDARPTGTGSLDSVRIAHKNITDAIAAGDSTTAREAMLQHLTEIVELTRPTLE